MSRLLPAALVLLTFAGCDGGASEPAVVDPADLSLAAVGRDLEALTSTRMTDGVRVDALGAVRLLCWEVRQIPEREAPSDLALLSAEFVKEGKDGYALGQAFRHREGSSVRWQWFVVRDPGWLELRLYDAPPSPAELEDFLRYWDFEAEGQNGRLLGAWCDRAAWAAALGQAPPDYPLGTPAPEAIK